jgi:hypothetical protein
VRLIFTDPRMRNLYPAWEGLARMCVAYLRMEAAENPDDLRLATLVGELSVQDPQFPSGGPAITSPSNGGAPGRTTTQ